MLAADSLRLGKPRWWWRRHGEHEAGPYLLDKARSGFAWSHSTVLDRMFLDGLQDAYEGS